LDWFKSYLKNRSINGIFSDEYNTTYRVPQGSVLKPELFILYINYVYNINIDGTIVSHADDMCLFLASDTCFNVKRIATVEVNNVF